MPIAENVARERVAAGLSQSGLAVAAGVTQPSISRIEAGGGVSLAKAAKIARALGVSLDYLLDRTPIRHVAQPPRRGRRRGQG